MAHPHFCHLPSPVLRDLPLVELHTLVGRPARHGPCHFFRPPIGFVLPVTNQQPSLNIVTEYVIGYLLPGDAIANVTFKTYGYIVNYRALTFAADLKLGHYMRIPPRIMFMAQILSTLLCGARQRPHGRVADRHPSQRLHPCRVPVHVPQHQQFLFSLCHLEALSAQPACLATRTARSTPPSSGGSWPVRSSRFRSGSPRAGGPISAG